MDTFPPPAWLHRANRALLGAVVAGALSCADSTSPYAGGTFFGPSTTMAGGSGRAYVVLDPSGAPTELGIVFSESALTGLSATKSDVVFPLPPEASATPYKHAVINWEPTGHGAAGSVYAVPHFDVHFYTVTQVEREAFVLGDPTLLAKMTRQPAAPFIPPDYVAGMPVAAMGMHWNDTQAPERLGQPFTSTFVYGSYDGAFVFAEPMVTRLFLESKQPSVRTPIKLPAQYATRGPQPTTYTVAHDAVTKEHRIALTDLVMR